MHGNRLADAKDCGHKCNGHRTFDVLNAEQTYPVTGRSIGLTDELGEVPVALVLHQLEQIGLGRDESSRIGWVAPVDHVRSALPGFG